MTIDQLSISNKETSQIVNEFLGDLRNIYKQLIFISYPNRTIDFSILMAIHRPIKNFVTYFYNAKIFENFKESERVPVLRLFTGLRYIVVKIEHYFKSTYSKNGFGVWMKEDSELVNTDDFFIFAGRFKKPWLSNIVEPYLKEYMRLDPVESYFSVWPFKPSTTLGEDHPYEIGFTKNIYEAWLSMVCCFITQAMTHLLYNIKTHMCIYGQSGLLSCNDKKLIFDQPSFCITELYRCFGNLTKMVSQQNQISEMKDPILAVNDSLKRTNLFFLKQKTATQMVDYQKASSVVKNLIDQVEVLVESCYMASDLISVYEQLQLEVCRDYLTEIRGLGLF